MSITNQEKNLHAGNLFTVWAGLMYVLTGKTQMPYLIMIGIVWAAFFWQKQIKLRRSRGCHLTRNFNEIWNNALIRRGNSLVLMLPLTCGCLIALAYLTRGIGGITAGIIASLTYSALVLLSERYPVV